MDRPLTRHGTVGPPIVYSRASIRTIIIQITRRVHCGEHFQGFGSCGSRTKITILRYHDHSDGITSQTVYYGQAGVYLIHDPAEDVLGLPDGAYDIPLGVMDKIYREWR